MQLDLFATQLLNCILLKCVSRYFGHWLGIITSLLEKTSSFERQKSLATSHLHMQLGPFASELTNFILIELIYRSKGKNSTNKEHSIAKPAIRSIFMTRTMAMSVEVMMFYLFHLQSNQSVRM